MPKSHLGTKLGTSKQHLQIGSLRQQQVSFVARGRWARPAFKESANILYQNTTVKYPDLWKESTCPWSQVTRVGTMWPFQGHRGQELHPRSDQPEGGRTATFLKLFITVLKTSKFYSQNVFFHRLVCMGAQGGIWSTLQHCIWMRGGYFHLSLIKIIPLNWKWGRAKSPPIRWATDRVQRVEFRVSTHTPERVTPAGSFSWKTLWLWEAGGPWAPLQGAHTSSLPTDTSKAVIL